jgi:O-antigen/teichoic acid export membrane protein
MLLHLFTTNLLVGINEIGAFNRVQLVSNVTVLLAMLGAGLAGFRAAGVLVAITAAWSATGVWAVTVLARRGGLGAVSFEFDRSIFGLGFRYAAKAYVATLCGFLVLRSNVFALQAVGGNEQLGYYSVAAQLSDMLAVLPQSVALVLFPALVSAPAAAWERTSRQALAIAITLGLVCLLVASASPVLVTVLFGEAFAPAVDVLRWLLPAAFFTGVTSVISQYAAAAGFPRALVRVWISGLIVGIATSAFFVPRFGGTGAAMALSLTQAVIFVLILGLCLQIQRRQAATVSVRG